MLLSDLTKLAGVSGNEAAVREYLYRNIKDKCDEITIDTMGNMVALLKGTAKNPKKVMLDAHMDEIGFIISRITEDGFLKFKSVGGIDPRVMVSKNVLIGEKSVPGVIGYKAIHLQEKSERETAAKEKNLYIDIGAKNKKDAEKLVQLGDYVVFDSDYREFGDARIKAKALDDRCGCAILAELAGKHFPFDLYLSFSVQEETGCRGAKITARRIKPDLAVVLESTSCSNVPGVSPQDYVTELGKGVAVSILDRGTYYDKSLSEFLFNLAQDNNIPVQYKKSDAGANNARSIQPEGGVRVAALSIPARYIHSPSSVICKRDYLACRDLITLFLQEAELCLHY